MTSPSTQKEKEYKHMGDVAWCECNCHTSNVKNCPKCYTDKNYYFCPHCLGRDGCMCALAPKSSPSTQKGKEWEDWELDLSALLAMYREPKFEQERLVKVLYFARQLLHSKRQKLLEEIREDVKAFGSTPAKDSRAFQKGLEEMRETVLIILDLYRKEEV